MKGNIHPEPHLLVEPPESVREELMTRNTSLKDLIEQARLTYLDMQGLETGVARWFTERGYSPEFANWIAAEAAACEREQR